MREVFDVSLKMAVEHTYIIVLSEFGHLKEDSFEKNDDNKFTLKMLYVAILAWKQLLEL